MTTTYANYDFTLSGTLTAATNYWVLVERVSTNATDILYMDSVATGTNEWVAGNGTIWTTDPTARGYYYVYTRSSRGLYASSQFAEGIYGVSTYGSAVVGTSTQGTGIYGLSTYGTGGLFNSGNGINNTVNNVNVGGAIYNFTQ
jgi:hypothetical protein